MNETKKRILGIIARYAIIILISLGNFSLIYKLVTPPTVRVLALTLRQFYNITVIENFIRVRGVIIEVAPECTIALTFFVIFMLILSTPDIKPKRRAFVLIASAAILFILNIARIVFIVSIIHSQYFAVTHWFIENILSAFVAFGIWLAMVLLLKIKKVPVLSDLKYIHSLIKKSKR